MKFFGSIWLISFPLLSNFKKLNYKFLYAAKKNSVVRTYFKDVDSVMFTCFRRHWYKTMPRIFEVSKRIRKKKKKNFLRTLLVFVFM